MRIWALNKCKEEKGPVVYWMSRDQRTPDNWALIYAQERALEQGASLAVIFCLAPAFLGATMRQCSLIFKGLLEVEEHPGRLNMPFYLLEGNPREIV